MPVSPVFRRLGRRLSVVTDRLREYMAEVGPEGVSGARVTADVLTDVDPRDCDELLTLLHRRGLIWVSRRKGVVRVYRERPGTMPKAEGPSLLDQFIAEVAPLMLEAVKRVDDREAAKAAGERLIEVDEAVRVAAGRVVAMCRRWASKGLALAEMRSAMWQLFQARAMRALATPELQQESDLDAFEGEQAPRRLPNGLSLDERIRRLIERAGKRGITASDLMQAIQPRIKRADLDEIAGRLQAEGLIVSGVMRATMAGRSGLRLFAAEHGLPYVAADGLAVWTE